MGRWMSRVFIGLCGLVRPPGRFVDVGGYRLHLWCTGDGAPGVILDAGLGGTSAGWGFVQPEVARFTRVCSCDRAGMGYSDPGPSPRTARRVASELAELLARSGITGPSCSSGNPSPASTFVSLLTITRSGRQASCSWMCRTKTMRMTCRGWRDSFPCCRRSASSDCLACRSARESSRWLHQFSDTRRRHGSRGGLPGGGG